MEFLFVVDPKKEAEMKKISDATTLKYKALFGQWLVRMAGLNPGNLLDLAAYTSALTAQAYKEIVTEASSQRLFLEPEEAEVTETS